MNPKLYGDKATRFFAYWTVSTYFLKDQSFCLLLFLDLDCFVTSISERQVNVDFWLQRDSYESIGCFDLTCPGFVQTGTGVSLGAAIQPVSSEFGPQYVINVGMFLVMITCICIYKPCSLTLNFLCIYPNFFSSLTLNFYTLSHIG